MDDWTPERHECARQRCEAATPLPWKAHIYEWGYVLRGPDCKIVKAEFDENPLTKKRQAADANFMANARFDLPDALSHIEAQRERMEELKRDNERLREALRLVDAAFSAVAEDEIYAPPKTATAWQEATKAVSAVLADQTEGG